MKAECVAIESEWESFGSPGGIGRHEPADASSGVARKSAQWHFASARAVSAIVCGIRPATSAAFSTSVLAAAAIWITAVMQVPLHFAGRFRELGRFAAGDLARRFGIDGAFARGEKEITQLNQCPAIGHSTAIHGLGGSIRSDQVHMARPCAVVRIAIRDLNRVAAIIADGKAHRSSLGLHSHSVGLGSCPDVACPAAGGCGASE